MTTTESFVATVNTVQLHYYAAGSGAPLLLLHGIGDSARDWLPLMQTLAEDRRVYALDLPGAGDSDKPAIDYGAREQVPFIVGFLDLLGIERVALAGHSRGGLIALYTALDHQERVSHLILLDSGGLGKRISLALLASTTPGLGELGVFWNRTPLGALQRAYARALLMFEKPWKAPSDWLKDQARQALMPGFLEATLAALRAETDVFGQREVLLEELAEIDASIQIIWGEADAITPVDHARAAAARLPGARLEIIPGCGHLPHVEQPELVAPKIRSFLAQELHHQP